MPSRRRNGPVGSTKRPMLLLDPADAASPPSAATCPYLAPADDIDSVALYPRADHRCRATGGNQPDLAWQQQYCLSIDYQRCRFYQPLALLPQSAAASASMQTADHQTQPSRPRPWRRIRLILLPRSRSCWSHPQPLACPPAPAMVCPALSQPMTRRRQHRRAWLPEPPSRARRPHGQQQDRFRYRSDSRRCDGYSASDPLRPVMAHSAADLFWNRANRRRPDHANCHACSSGNAYSSVGHDSDHWRCCPHLSGNSVLPRRRSRTDLDSRSRADRDTYATSSNRHSVAGADRDPDVAASYDSAADARSLEHVSGDTCEPAGIE